MIKSGRPNNDLQAPVRNSPENSQETPGISLDEMPDVIGHSSLDIPSASPETQAVMGEDNAPRPAEQTPDETPEELDVELRDDNESPETLPPCPKNGQYHTRFGKEEWAILQKLYERRGTSVNEVINYLARYYSAYPVDLEILHDRVRSIEAHTTLMEAWTSDLIDAVEDLQKAVQELHDNSLTLSPSTPQTRRAETPKTAST